jgi:hypothetical protein
MGVQMYTHVYPSGSAYERRQAYQLKLRELKMMMQYNDPTDRLTLTDDFSKP